jgi:predicted membrane-bound dolichyl-phosphate-mannose-protein mannosyltransferase
MYIEKKSLYLFFFTLLSLFLIVYIITTSFLFIFRVLRHLQHLAKVSAATIKFEMSKEEKEIDMV